METQETDGSCTQCGSEDIYELQDPSFDIGYSICKSCGATFHAEITTSFYEELNGIEPKLPEGFEPY